MACSCVSAFSVGIIEAAEAEKAMNKLRTLAENNQQVVILYLGCASVFFLSIYLILDTAFPEL